MENVKENTKVVNDENQEQNQVPAEAEQKPVATVDLNQMTTKELVIEAAKRTASDTKATLKNKVIPGAVKVGKKVGKALLIIGAVGVVADKVTDGQVLGVFGDHEADDNVATDLNPGDYEVTDAVDVEPGEQTDESGDNIE